MTKPVSTSNKPRKQHTPEFCQEALKLAERIGVADAPRDYESEKNVPESQWHAHDQNGGALNQDGSIHDKFPNFPNKVMIWLQHYGWNVDNWL